MCCLHIQDVIEKLMFRPLISLSMYLWVYTHIEDNISFVCVYTLTQKRKCVYAYTHSHNWCVQAYILTHTCTQTHTRERKGGPLSLPYVCVCLCAYIYIREGLGRQAPFSFSLCVYTHRDIKKELWYRKKRKRHTK